MRQILCALGLTALAIAPVAESRAQGAEEEVLKTVRQLFDGMRKGDSATVRAVFHKDAVLLRPVDRNGQMTVQRVPVDDFVKFVGTPHAEVFDERVWNEKVLIDGPLAIAWMEYAFFLGTKFSHCGVDAFQFAKMADGWKIIGLADTQRREGCKQGPS